MNEDLIRIFANQASEYTEGLELNQGELTPELLKARDLKFAELIINDSIAAIRAKYVDYGTTAAVIAIEEHFGVEE